MLDIIIKGGDVVTPDGVAKRDIAIKGETIAAIAAPGALDGVTAGRTIDAKGKIVMPGGVDPHMHMNHPFVIPGGQHYYTRGPDHVGMAALYGGTTTLIDFAYILSDGSVQGGIESREKQFKSTSICDYAYHLMLHTDPAPKLMGELAEAIQAGHPTIKIFTTNIWPHRKGRMVDFGDIWEVYKVVAKEGGLAVMHGEDNDIVMHMYDVLIREGRVGFENLAKAHNQLSEDLSFRRILRLAEATGAALYMMHVSAGTGVTAIEEARAKGQPIYGESLHQYMLFTEEDYKRPNGQIYHTYPSLETKEDQKRLWDGTLSGAINCVATDDLCCTLAEKTLGNRIDDTVGGNSGAEPRLAVMYTEMVTKRGYSLSKYVDMISTNAAKIMGLYPRKGCLAAGSDADITILDPTRRGKIRKEDLHQTDYSPWEGHEINAWPITVLLRGKVMVEGGKFFGKAGEGKHLKRKIPTDFLKGPML